jgi:hypothetical protein
MGVLMCGISVSTLFAIATRLIGNETVSGSTVSGNRKLPGPASDCLSESQFGEKNRELIR